MISYLASLNLLCHVPCVIIYFSLLFITVDSFSNQEVLNEARYPLAETRSIYPYNPRSSRWTILDMQLTGSKITTYGQPLIRMAYVMQHRRVSDYLGSQDS